MEHPKNGPLILGTARLWSCTKLLALGLMKLKSLSGYLRRTPHPVIVTIGDNRDHVRVLLYSYDTTITEWGVLLRDICFFL